MRETARADLKAIAETLGWPREDALCMLLRAAAEALNQVRCEHENAAVVEQFGLVWRPAAVEIDRCPLCHVVDSDSGGSSTA